jgi:hypothetical protein
MVGERLESSLRPRRPPILSTSSAIAEYEKAILARTRPGRWREKARRGLLGINYRSLRH